MNVLSEEFGKEMQQKLQAEKQDLLTQITELKAQDPFLDPDHVNDNAAVDKDAQEEEGHDRIAAVLEETTAKVVDIDNALKRMEDGTYGVCDNCGKPIGEDRLRVNPTAIKCVECETLTN